MKAHYRSPEQSKLRVSDGEISQSFFVSSVALSVELVERWDIYALGVIFFELFHKFKSAKERASLLREFKRRVLPSSFLLSYPNESAFVLLLTSPKPSDRPHASDMLKSDLLQPDQVTLSKKNYQKLAEKLQDQENVIQQQEALLKQQEKQLKKLQRSNRTI